jgi:hypothetical protein
MNREDFAKQLKAIKNGYSKLYGIKLAGFPKYMLTEPSQLLASAVTLLERGPLDHEDANCPHIPEDEKTHYVDASGEVVQDITDPIQLEAIKAYRLKKGK